MASTSTNISVFPEDLFERRDIHFGNCQGDAETNLWVLYTKARHEKSLARRAIQRDVPFFLPLINQLKHSRGHRYNVRTPLFPGYVFLIGTNEERIWSMTTNHVSRVLTVPEPERLFQDLQQISHLIRTDAIVRPEHRLTPGKPVRVMAGPLRGLEGHVLTQRGKTRLLVSVDFLQQGASVEIDVNMLEPLD